MRKKEERLNWYWERYRKENRIPSIKTMHSWLRSFFTENPLHVYVPTDRRGGLSKRKRIALKKWDGFRALRQHVKDKYIELPENYREFKKKMRFFYGWDFSVLGAD